MANLARIDPFNLTRFDPFQDMFGSLMPSTIRSAWDRMSEPQIPVSILETDTAYMLTAEVPGVRKDDIDVNIYQNQVTINTEMKEEKEAGMEGKMMCNERLVGKVSRTIRLPLEIDEKGADAKCMDGLLHLTLPKKASSMAKHIAIH